MIPIDEKSQIRRRNSLFASYSSSSSSSSTTTTNNNNDTNTNTAINNTSNNIMRRRMSLPGSLRPLKKRRIVSITDFQDDISVNVNVNASMPTLTKSSMNNNIMNVNNNDVAMTTTPPTPTKKNVSWIDLNGNIMIHSQDYHSNHVFNERDVWYTREDYDEFLLDRVRTIECLRGMKRSKDNMDMDNCYYCIRGLEPFHDTNTSKQFHSKKKLYNSTVIIEQVRQGMLGIKEPERFRFLVSPQSDLAILRAQELASQDEKEVYPYRNPSSSSSSSPSSFYNYDDSCTSGDDNTVSQHQQQNRRSSMSALSTLQRQRRSSIIMNSNIGGGGGGGISNTYYNNNEMGSSFDSSTSTATRRNSTNFTTTTDTDTTTKSNTPSLFTDSIRRLQEKNARRLMGIYAHDNGEGVHQRSCSNFPPTTKMTNEGHNLFRYSVRRNSLLGMLGANTSTTTTTTTAPTFASSSSGQQQQIMQHLLQPMETATASGSSNGVNNNIDTVVNSHRRQHHKQLIEGAMLAMRTTRFPIRRDTLSHLQQTHNHNHNNNQHTDNGVFPIPTDAFVFSQNARSTTTMEGSSSSWSSNTSNNDQQNFMKYSTTAAQ